MKLQKWMISSFKTLRGKKAPPPQGCPKCGRKGLIYDARPRNGYMWRRHACVKRHTWTTIEIVVNDHGNGLNTHTQALKLMRDDAVRSVIDTLKGQL